MMNVNKEYKKEYEAQQNWRETRISMKSIYCELFFLVFNRLEMPNGRIHKTLLIFIHVNGGVLA